MRKTKNLILILIILFNTTLIFNIAKSQINNIDTLTLLTINDFHAHVESFKSEYSEKTGGMALLSGYIDYYRKKQNDVAWVIAGDHFQGSPIDTITKGEALIELLNIVPPDVFGLGNHEFDYGKDILLERINQAKFPIICANLVYEENDKYFTNPYIIKDIDGVKVLFIGVITEDLHSLVLKRNTSGLKILKSKIVVEKIAKEFIDSVDLTVIVSHLGYESDIILANSLNPSCGVDIIVGGHSHTYLEKPTIENGIIIVQTEGVGKYLGKLDLKIDLSKNTYIYYNWTNIPIIETQEIKPHKEVEKKLKEMLTPINDYLNTDIGKIIFTSLIHDNNLEMVLGNFSTDAIVEKFGVDISFQNRGGLRSWIGDNNVIKIKNVWETFPFSNYWVKFTINTEQLWKILERNSTLEGEYLMIPYTLRYKFDSSRPKGNRVIKIWFKGKEIKKDDNILFTCVTCNFIWDHAEEIFGLTQQDIIQNGGFEEFINYIDRDLYIDYIKQKKKIYLANENRVVDIKINKNPLIYVNLRSGNVFNKDKILINGFVEKGTKLYVNENIVELMNENEFLYETNLKNGENEILFIAKDEDNNETKLKYVVFCFKKPEIYITNLKNEIFTNNNKIQVEGKVINYDEVMLYKDNDTILLDENGNFSFNLDLIEGENITKIIAINPLNDTDEKVLKVILDTQPPEIYYNVPQKVYDKNLTILGYVRDKGLSGIKENSLIINGEKVELNENLYFQKLLILSEGYNKIIFEVEDMAGNKILKELQINYIKQIILELQIGNNIMYVNDIPKEIDVPPTIIEGRTLLPIRWVAEPLGASIGWDANEKKVTVSLKDTIIELWIGKNVARVDGVDTPIDPNNPKVVPMIIQGRTMLPVRFVAENLGSLVNWYPITKKVTIIYPK